MPRAFFYTGPACNLGRFGAVEAGVILDLTLDEEVSVEGNPEFAPVRELTSKPLVALRGASVYDLRFVDWSINRNPVSNFLNRHRGRELILIAMAMVEIGCDIAVYEGEPQESIADSIIREARRNQWHLLSTHDCHQCPGVGETEPVVEPAAEEEAQPAKEEEVKASSVAKPARKRGVS